MPIQYLYPENAISPNCGFSLSAMSVSLAVNFLLIDSILGGNAIAQTFNGRTGNVFPETNDYSFNQISGTLGLGQIPLGGDDQSYLRGDGSWAYPLSMTTTQYGDYPALDTDITIFCAGSGAQSITLPTDAGVYVGKTYVVKLTGVGPITVHTSSTEYSGSITLSTAPSASHTGGHVTLQWDGSDYWILDYAA